MVLAKVLRGDRRREVDQVQRGDQQQPGDQQQRGDQQQPGDQIRKASSLAFRFIERARTKQPFILSTSPYEPTQQQAAKNGRQ
ncbi:hypothetical protein K227x_42160 [Rubripirellula lacrimiformis]|uniref:Uncharacterized protein n=1 Tax=Rubripirellula lacrimiformis TaxID=1930273 RepID=A0A517NFA0_9BACT|nr:hypothetical protein K227x_42160 [Rubripirellula lacrimiformis]